MKISPNEILYTHTNDEKTDWTSSFLFDLLFLCFPFLLLRVRDSPNVSQTPLLRLLKDGRIVQTGREICLKREQRLSNGPDWVFPAPVF